MCNESLERFAMFHPMMDAAEKAFQEWDAWIAIYRALSIADQQGERGRTVRKVMATSHAVYAERCADLVGFLRDVRGGAPVSPW